MKAVQDFKKYNHHGAYHWKSTYGAGVFLRSPRAIIRYELPVRLLAERLDLRQVQGLDVGCGDGVGLYRLLREGGEVMGLDASETAIELAREKLAEHGFDEVSVAVGSCYELPLDAESVDFVSAVELIEHIEDPEDFLAEVHRVLRPGGWFVCTSPNRPEYVDKDVVSDPFHVHEFSISELNAVLNTHFEEVSVYGILPMWLERLYKRPTPFSIINKGVRLAFKVVAGLGYNPFLNRIESDPDDQFGQLIALSRKPR